MNQSTNKQNDEGDQCDQAVWVVIPAAGVGKRMQSDVPKQYIRILDKTVIEHTLECFTSHPRVAGIVIALHSDDPYWKNIANKIQSAVPIYTVEGGQERCESVMQGLDYLSMVERLKKDQWVMVHDAARPCLISKDIDALLALINQTDDSANGAVIGGILATPVKDTMKRAKQGTNTILKTESRDDLWHALTPQLFRLGELYDALEQGLDAQANITDEASALERLDKFPVLVEGSATNIKITHPGDVEIATDFLSSKLQIKDTE